MRTHRLGGWIILGLLAALAWAFLAPPALGGQTNYVATHGASMAPTFHTGDLALVRPRSAYQVGDVVAYHSPTLDIVVLHRIVAAKPEGFVIRGDNNAWNDPDTIPPGKIIGRLWLHIPRAGAVLARTGTVVPAALLVVLLAAAPAGAAVRRRHHRRRKVLSVHRARPRPHPPASLLLTVAAVAAVIGVALLFVSVRAQTRPATSGTITHQLDLTYEAPADATVYQGGRLVTGDPVFLRLNRMIDVRVHDHASGTPGLPRLLSLQARVTGASGWQYSVPLPGHPVRHGADSELRVSLDLQEVQDLLTRAQARTGVAEGSYQLQLVPSLVPADPTATPATALDFSPIVFQLQRGELVLEPGQHQRATPVTRSLTEPGRGTGAQGQHLQLAGVSVPAWPLRPIGVGALLVAVVSGGVASLRYRRDPLARLTQPVITITRSHMPDAAVATTSLNELLNLARRYDRPVLHLPLGSQSVYLVEESATWYRYAPAQPISPADPGPLRTVGPEMPIADRTGVDVPASVEHPTSGSDQGRC